MVPRRRSECNPILIKNRPGGLRVLVLIGARGLVHAIANANYGLDVSVKGQFAGCEDDVLVVDDPLHHGSVISTGIVGARFSQELRIGNHGNREIGARCRHRRRTHEARRRRTR